MFDAARTRRARGGSLAVLATLLVPAIAPTQEAALRRAVAEAEALGARTGVAVCDRMGEVLYRHRAAEVFAPASNQKILTAAAVLRGLGRSFTYRTRFALRDGTVVVTSSGDPNWISDGPHDPAQIFAGVAAKLRQHGVSAVRDVVLEPGSFVGPSRPPGWPKDQLYTYYCAPTGAFVLEQGTFLLSVEGTRGATAEATLLAPQAGYPIEGSIRMSAKKKGAVYGAIDQGDSVRVRGSFYRRSPRVEIRTATDDPERWYRDALVTALRRGGVRVAADAARDVDTELMVYESSLLPAIRRMLEDSSNFDAEQCLRVLGANTLGDGSLRGGMRAMRQELERLCKVLPDAVVLTDGSGLSKDNRVTPGLLVVSLLELSRLPEGAALCERLPVAGRTGTLKNRFVGTDLVDRVRAKTGWIRGASSLSGVVYGDAGEPRWFSILMAYDRGRNGFNKDLKRLQERIVAAIDGIPAAR